jgi:pyridoxine 5'-phosphate synthase PdxJ
MAYDKAMTPEQIAAISDPHALRAAALQMASEQLASIAAHTTELAARDREIDFKQRRIDALTAEIARLKRVQFGAKTEALSALQKSLFDEAVDEDAVQHELKRLRDASVLAHQAGMLVNAGHGLSFSNIRPFLAEVPYLHDISIGHALIAHALYHGLASSVRQMADIITAHR